VFKESPGTFDMKLHIYIMHCMLNRTYRVCLLSSKNCIANDQLFETQLLKLFSIIRTSIVLIITLFLFRNQSAGS
jgi:hypothetical protein